MLYCKNYVIGIRGKRYLYWKDMIRKYYHPVAEEYDIFYGEGIMYMNGHNFI